jgi:hypothetical protein
MGKSKKERQERSEYRRDLLAQKSKSDEDFEKYITFISSGALGLTLTFINEISPLKESIGIWIISSGWILLAITLFINLLSHFLSSRYNEKTLKDIDENIDNTDFDCKLERRNNIISALNFISIGTLGLGITSILIFTIINAYQ